jgi:hypothetical protein
MMYSFIYTVVLLEQDGAQVPQLLSVFFAPKVPYDCKIVHRCKVILLHSPIQNIVCG